MFGDVHNACANHPQYRILCFLKLISFWPTGEVIRYYIHTMVICESDAYSWTMWAILFSLWVFCTFLRPWPIVLHNGRKDEVVFVFQGPSVPSRAVLEILLSPSGTAFAATSSCSLQGIPPPVSGIRDGAEFGFLTSKANKLTVFSNYPKSRSNVQTLIFTHV